MIRAFVAIDLPESVLSQLELVSGKLKDLKADGRFPDSGALHLTLKFLGNVTEEEIPEIGQVLEHSALGISSFRIAVRSLGVFPHLADPRVVWVGVDSGEELRTLQKRLEEGFHQLGFEKEKRPFRPHLTLVRLKSRKNMERLIRYLREEGAAVEAGVAVVNAVHLYQSILRLDGAVYARLLTVALTTDREP